MIQENDKIQIPSRFMKMSLSELEKNKQKFFADLKKIKNLQKTLLLLP